jgi:2-polyprenyl-3-methyl-5-hydroxy-6-metoxy-1,4-benzoquinol methylase
LSQPNPQTASEPATHAHVEKVLTLDGLADYFWGRPLVGQHRSDIGFHAVRWVHLLSHVDRLVERTSDPAALRLLDIGVSLQTELLKHNYPGRVDTLDIDDSDTMPTGAEQAHLLDLNSLYYEDRRPDLGPYDVIVMCEVIEHLHTGPDRVLAGVGAWLKPGGHLFVQTPNAVALHKRVELMAGINPYMELSGGTPTSPPHFHEYTIDELAAAGQAAGLEVVDRDARNYFTSSRRGSALYNRLCESLPRALRAGLSITYRRPA